MSRECLGQRYIVIGIPNTNVSPKHCPNHDRVDYSLWPVLVLILSGRGGSFYYTLRCVEYQAHFSIMALTHSLVYVAICRWRLVLPILLGYAARTH